MKNDNLSNRNSNFNLQPDAGKASEEASGLKIKDTHSIKLDDGEIDQVEVERGIYFLLSKELSSKSLKEKKEFLKGKISDSALQEALKLYPLAARVLSKEKEKFKESNSSASIKYLKEIGIYSSLIIMTLGVNYLLDIARNKKSDLQQKNFEVKLNEQLKIAGEKLSEELKTEMSNYIPNASFPEKFKQEYDKARGTLNLHPQKNTGLMLKKLEEDSSSTKLSVDELKNKVDNLKITINSEMREETKNLFTQMNDNVIALIKKEQEKFLSIVLSKSEAVKTNSQPQIESNIIQMEQEPQAFIPPISSDQVVKAETSINNDTEEINKLINDVLDGATKENQILFVNLINMQFKGILESDGSKPSSINTSNAQYKRLKKSDEVGKLIKYLGFTTSNNILYVLENLEESKSKIETLLILSSKISNSLANPEPTTTN